DWTASGGRLSLLLGTLNALSFPMNGFVCLVLLFVAGALMSAGAKAMPVAPIKMERETLLIADGCGFNRYKDARGICRRKYVIERHPGKRALYNACGGLNSHRVCNLYGNCWMVCD